MTISMMKLIANEAQTTAINCGLFLQNNSTKGVINKLIHILKCDEKRLSIGKVNMLDSAIKYIY